VQAVNIFSSQMDNTANICYLLHGVTVFTLVKSFVTLKSEIFILIHPLYSKTVITLLLKWSSNVECKPKYAVSYNWLLSLSLYVQGC